MNRMVLLIESTAVCGPVAVKKISSVHRQRSECQASISLPSIFAARESEPTAADLRKYGPPSITLLPPHSTHILHTRTSYQELIATN